MVDHEKDYSASTAEANNKEEEVSIDFSEIKKKVGNFFKIKEAPHHHSHTIKNSEEEPSLDFSGAAFFFKKNAKWIIPVMCILIAIFISVYLRTTPERLPITDNWAQNTVYNYYQQNIVNRINQQYPNLPDANKQILVDKEWKKQLQENKDIINQQITATSNQFKSHYQYEDQGKTYTYLLDIDSYLWLGYAKNYLKCGHTGCDLKEDGQYYTYRNGRDGLSYGMNNWVLLGLFFHKITNIFTYTPLMQSFLLLPAFIIALSILPAFFIGRKLGGNVGGFFAAIFIAINQSILSRSVGTSDNDAANVLFPLLILWFFIEAVSSKKWKNTLLFSLAGGVSFYIYSSIWHTEQFYVFIIGTAAIFFIAEFIKEKIVEKNNFRIKNFFLGIKDSMSRLGLFLGISLIFSMLAESIHFIPNIVKNILGFVFVKQVAVNTIWPNVVTTVAEFNTVPLGDIIGQMGGKIFCLIALLGMIFIFLKRSKENQNLIISIILTLWLIGTAYSFTKGIRFSLLMAPAFGILFGIGIGITYQYLGSWISKEMKIKESITKIILIVLACLLLIPSITTASDISKSSLPLYNDEWENTLATINKDAGNQTGYITTWWDYGHFFVAHDARVTFDGGDNQEDKIHWVGKSLLTDNEKLNLGLLKMLNCGQAKGSHLIENYLQGDIIKSIEIINQIIVQDKENAKKTLQGYGLTDEAIQKVLDTTHCEDLLPQYFITSGDMVGKAGVWGHFGAWDFERAEIWQKVRGMPREEAITLLTSSKHNFTPQQADQYYSEIQTTDADRWIAPWPGYMGDTSCDKRGEVLECPFNAGGGTALLKIDLKNLTATVPTRNGLSYPNSLVYATKEGIKEKKFQENLMGVSVILLPDNRIILSDPLQAKSIFTQLYFFEGHGLRCFNLLDKQRQINGEWIYLWKVDWTCQDQNQIYFLPQVHAEHILISTEKRTDEQALQLIKEIQSKITSENFEQLAKEYSDDTGSAKNGGDVGWFGPGMMVAEFEKAAYQLKKGEVSAPVKTQFGYHLIKLVDREQS